ncbi:MAG: cbb3-type cytochrome c oxidase subunit I [Anaerolineales bacterium]
MATTALEPYESHPPRVRGLTTILTAVDHKKIGLRWIITAFTFFVLAGLLALTMVTQLSQPGLGVLSSEAYNQFFTMHGMTMMFYFAVPIMLGLGIYFVPLLIGAREVAFPRLNAFAYWVYLFSGVALWIALLLGRAPDAGWFNYTPLAGPTYSPGINVDLYALSIAFLEAANLTAALILVITIFKMRAPGMSINRMPVFVWSILIASLMIIFAMPSLMLATLMLALDRIVGTHFFRIPGGGTSFLWQHLFWFFGHPEVYIIAIPAFGIVSTIVPVFSRRRLVGYLPVVLSQILIGIISFGLWVHHMFAGELSVLAMTFFAAASMSIAIPSGVQVFAWIGTIWLGAKPVFKAAYLWALGFIPLFVIGGITGVMVAAPPFDWQVHDSHFVTAHFHYVLVGGAVFPLVGMLYYWFPKLTGRLLNEKLGRWSFWMAFIGFNVAFFILHYTGFRGMPRRMYTYMEGLGWGTPMTITWLGALGLGAGFALTLFNVLKSLTGGERAGNDPWEAGTLEWATTSPPPPYNFEQVPCVGSRMPLWYALDRGQEGCEVAYDLPENERLTIGTSTLDGEPEQRLLVAGPGIAPFLMAIGGTVAFYGALLSLWLVPVGALIAFAAIVLWNWPGRHREKEQEV